MFRTLFGRHRDRTVLVLALVVSGALLALDDGTQFDVARGLGATLYAPIQAVTQNGAELLVLRRENRQLRRLVATLNLERMRLVQLRDDRERWRREAHFARDRFPVLLPCEVVGRATDRQQDMMVLAAGARDSVRVDMPVAAYAGLVGRVRQVTDDRTLVETLMSPGLAVSSRDQRSGVIGILRWLRGSQFVLDRVDAVEDVLVGDPLVTSGYGGIYPRGIPVGVVTRVENSLDGLFKQISVRPYVELGGVEDVFVVRRLVPWEDDALYDTADRDLLENYSAAPPGTAGAQATGPAGKPAAARKPAGKPAAVEEGD